MPHAATQAPRDASSVSTLTVGGNGQDGTVGVLRADGQAVFQTVRGSVGLNGALKHIAARMGGGTIAGLLHLVNGEGRQTVHHRCLRIKTQNACRSIRCLKKYFYTLKNYRQQSRK